MASQSFRSDPRLLLLKSALPIALILLWALAMAWSHRNVESEDVHENAKVDAIAFYTGAWMITHGQTSQLYGHQMKTLDLYMERAAGVPLWASRDIQQHRIIPGHAYVEAARTIGYPDDSPPVFVYFPIYALLFTPLLLFPWPGVTLLFDILNLAAIAAALYWFMLRLTEDRHSSWSWKRRLGALALLLVPLTFYYPLQFSLYCGQITPLLAAVTLFCVFCSRQKGWQIATGIAAALVAGIKLFPALLLLHFYFTHRRIAALSMFITLIVLAALSFLIFGYDLNLKAVMLMADLLKGARLWLLNQSADASFQRFMVSVNFTQDWWGISPEPLKFLAVNLKLILVILWLLGLWRLRSAKEKDADNLAGVTVLTLLVFIPPISWIHYYILILPALLYLILAAPWQNPAINRLLKLLAILVFLAVCIDIDWVRNTYKPLIRLYDEDFGSIIFRFLAAIPFLSALFLYIVLFCHSLILPAQNLAPSEDEWYPLKPIERR